MPDLAASLRASLPSGVVLGVASRQVGEEPLWPGEAVPGAVRARVAEFALGRSAARAALRGLGLAPVAIPMQADRSPLWPPGVTGSISHCAGACMAIAGLHARFAGLGLDLEPTLPLTPDLWPILLRPEERDLDPLAVFVAKEAAYKAQYAITGTLFDFHTLSVRLLDDSYAAAFACDVGSFVRGDMLWGRLLRTARHTAAICTIPAA